MNCKQGDIAVIVESGSGNEGKIVQCMELLQNITCFDKFGVETCGPAWVISMPLPDWAGELGHVIHDRQLRPIRDNPGADETLTWCDVPSKVTA